MRTQRLSPALGVEVLDMDLSAPWDESSVAELQGLFAEADLLLFRQPDLEPEHQVRLVRALGLQVDIWSDGGSYGFLSNVRQDAPNVGQHNAYLWHSDLMWKATPIAAISLYAMAVPDEPSPTIFASAASAARHLPPDFRSRLRGEEGLFLIGYDGGASRYRLRDAAANSPRTTQPILYTDPVSGKECLVVDQLFMDQIVGWDPDDSEEARSEAHRYLYDPSNLYTHDWRVGDLVIWNNVTLQHSRPDLPAVGERTHRRVSGSYDRGLKAWDVNETGSATSSEFVG
jgi:taurine dioxygenase